MLSSTKLGMRQLMFMEVDGKRLRRCFNTRWEIITGQEDQQ